MEKREYTLLGMTHESQTQLKMSELQWALSQEISKGTWNRLTRQEVISVLEIMLDSCQQTNKINGGK